ncbi:MAG: hypothetical protein CVU89_01435 [Firmicutes bacterium HGW-Firmicutes-14]|nr:MAG: hypothetical protein CVU89_01435 [Firmicutes bacterium HGW-Firmicutes-14]
MNFFRGSLSLAFILILSVTLMGGCTAQKKPLPPAPGPTAPDRAPGTEVQPAPRTQAETRDIASDITRTAESVEGVEKAYTVAVGNTVLIGFDLEAGKQELGIAKIKNRVAEKAEADPRIVRAYVSSDPDITARIREISDNIRRGRPVTEYLDEIGEIIQRLTPKTD